MKRTFALYLTCAVMVVSANICFAAEGTVLSREETDRRKVEVLGYQDRIVRTVREEPVDPNPVGPLVGPMPTDPSMIQYGEWRDWSPDLLPEYNKPLTREVVEEAVETIPLERKTVERTSTETKIVKRLAVP